MTANLCVLFLVTGLWTSLTYIRLFVRLDSFIQTTEVWLDIITSSMD